MSLPVPFQCAAHLVRSAGIFFYAQTSMEVKTTYISCGCNRTPNSVDWGQNHLIIYGTNRAIAVTKPEVGVSVLSPSFTRELPKHVSDN